MAAPGGRRTRPLGVPADAGFARRRDLRRLTVGRADAGRVTLGRAGRRLLAAEPQASLAVIGPTGCGKTAGFAIPALLEWEGPVIATSVKADLLDATVAHRQRRGKVWIYDPTGAAGHAPRPSWSPLPAAAPGRAPCGSRPGSPRPPSPASTPSPTATTGTPRPARASPPTSTPPPSSTASMARRRPLGRHPGTRTRSNDPAAPTPASEAGHRRRSPPTRGRDREQAYRRRGPSARRSPSPARRCCESTAPTLRPSPTSRSDADGPTDRSATS